jgi:hypothetical protein
MTSLFFKSVEESSTGTTGKEPTGEIMFFNIQYEMDTHRFVFYVLILSKIDSFKRNIFRVSENIYI